MFTRKVVQVGVSRAIGYETRKKMAGGEGGVEHMRPESRRLLKGGWRVSMGIVKRRPWRCKE